MRKALATPLKGVVMALQVRGSHYKSLTFFIIKTNVYIRIGYLLGLDSFVAFIIKSFLKLECGPIAESNDETASPCVATWSPR